MTIPLFEQISETTEWLRSRTSIQPRAGIVLGTGLGSLVQQIHVTEKFDYALIPHFPVSTVESHKGSLVFGTIGSVPVVAMQGRFHYYEGYSMQQVTFPVRVMKQLGVQQLLLSNAAGGINPAFKKGNLTVITDHINMQTENPLRGLTDERLGPRFPDMSCPYDNRLSAMLHAAATDAGIKLHHGVYVAVNGPNLETRAEYRFLKTAGADMVGMSTVPEVIVANQLGLPCAAVSVITDECDPDHLQPVDIKEIIETAQRADAVLSKIFAGVIQQL